MDGGAWWAAVHGVARSWTRLSDFTFTFHFHALEKEMATHSSVLCLENPRDGGAWWAAVYGVTQSQTRLKRLSSSSRDMKINKRPKLTFKNWKLQCLRLKNTPSGICGRLDLKAAGQIFFRAKGKETRNDAKKLIWYRTSSCFTTSCEKK